MTIPDGSNGQLNIVGLNGLLAPSSIAIVGASGSNPNSYGSLALANLLAGGFGGAIYVVHPNQEELQGIQCARSIEELGAVPDLCILALAAPAIPEMLQRCAAIGVRAAVVVGSGFAESNTVEGVEYQRRVEQIADTSSIRVLGPNTIGAAGFSHHAVTAATANIPPHIKPGSVAVVSQSGGLGTTILAAAQRYGIGLHSFVALGNEVDITAADAIAYAVKDGASIVLCYLESLRHPSTFAVAAATAAEAGVPIVLLKGGTHPSGQAVTAAHTAALAGSTRILDSVLAEWSIDRVTSIESLVATGSLFERFGAAPGTRCGVLGLGGGNSALLADALDAAGVEIAKISSDTSKAIKDLLPDSNGANPLDTGGWFLSKNPELFGTALARFADDAAIDILIFGMVPLSHARDQVYTGGMARVASQSPKPAICISFHTPPTALREELFTGSGILELPCDDAATEALAVWQRQRPRRVEIAVPPDPLIGTSLTAALGERISADLATQSRVVLLEDQAIDLLGRLGVQFPNTAVADSAEAAVAAARRIGYPVVIKVLADGLMHRAQVGALALGVIDDDGVRSAVHRIAENASAVVDPGAIIRFLVASQVEHGTEMIVGIQRDPVFGAAVLVGMGGVWSEILDDVTFAIPPITTERAELILGRLRASKQLSRLALAGDFEETALVALIVQLGTIAVALNPILESVDLNPVIVTGQGISLVDALVVLQKEPVAAER